MPRKAKQHCGYRRKPSGFTLVEVMITVAIIGLLSAMAIPQFLNFRLKAMRSEAVLLIGTVAKVQESHLASNDKYIKFNNFLYWYTDVPPLGYATEADSKVDNPAKIAVRELNERLGIGNIDTTNHGYTFWYHIITPLEITDHNYGSLPLPEPFPQFYLVMTANLDSDAFEDMVGYQSNGPDVELPDPFGKGPYPNKQIVYMFDDVSNTAPAAPVVMSSP